MGRDERYWRERERLEILEGEREREIGEIRYIGEREI